MSMHSGSEHNESLPTVFPSSVSLLNLRSFVTTGELAALCNRFSASARFVETTDGVRLAVTDSSSTLARPEERLDASADSRSTTAARFRKDSYPSRRDSANVGLRLAIASCRAAAASN